MAKKKLIRFVENEKFACLHQLEAKKLIEDFHPNYGKWAANCFNNANELVLELGCGRGEYAIGLGRLFPTKNFIGYDIKGSRLYFGAKEVHETGVNNVAFVRGAIDFIDRVFAREVNEIWITFPDPFIEKPKRRLTSPFYLNRYLKVLKPGGIVNLKTDNVELFDFTNWLVRKNDLKILKICRNVHAQTDIPEVEAIQTTYEKKFVAQGKPIHLLRFVLNKAVTMPDAD